MMTGAVFDTEILIDEVSSRPELWNRSLKEYSDKEYRDASWRAVCTEVYPSWEQMDEEEQSKKSFEIRKKWKSLRDSYRREVNQKKTTTSFGRTKRKYIYFDRLDFLKSLTEVKPKNENGDISVSSFDDNCDYLQKTSPSPIPTNSTDYVINSQTNNEVVTPKPKRIKKERKSSNIPKIPKPEEDSQIYNEEVPTKPMISYDGYLQTILEESKEIDEDRSFALSLVPTLKSLPINKKLSAKMDLLQVLHRYSCELAGSP